MDTGRKENRRENETKREGEKINNFEYSQVVCIMYLISAVSVKQTLV